MKYKIEKKPGIYVIDRKMGEYSSRQHECDFIAANSPDEAWFLITEYWKAIYGLEERDSWWDGVKRARWGEKRMRLDTPDPEWPDLDWDSGYDDIWTCEVKMLPVIVPQSLDRTDDFKVIKEGAGIFIGIYPEKGPTGHDVNVFDGTELLMTVTAGLTREEAERYFQQPRHWCIRHSLNIQSHPDDVFRVSFK